jgi:DNA mismatch repair protein MutS
MSIVSEYLKLTETWKSERGENVIVLYQNGSFFEIFALQDINGKIYGSNIEDVSKICDLKIATKNIKSGNDNVLMAGFKIEAIEKYLTKLSNSGYIIPIYEQEENKSGSGFIRKLTNVISPGTFWINEQDIISNSTTCIWIHHCKYRSKKNPSERITIGLSNLDIFTGKSSIFEFSNEYQHDPSTYDELQRYISINNPSEILIIHNLTDTIVNDIIKFTNIECSSLVKIDISKKDMEFTKSAERCEKQTYQSEIIKKFIPSFNDEIFFENYMNYPYATQSFCFLIDYVSRHNPNLVNKIKLPVFENCSDRLVLANHSLLQLNIINDNRYNGKLSSVCNFLNNCITNMGKRKFINELLNPTKDIDYLNKIYNITEHTLNKRVNFLQNNNSEKSWEVYRKHLYNIKDIEKLTRKMIIKKITPRDISVLFNTINNIISLNTLVSNDEILMLYLNKNTIKQDCQDIINYINSQIDIEKSENINDISFDCLSSYSINNITFIKPGLSISLDETIKNYYDSKDKFECIRAFLSNRVALIEKKNDKNTQYIKIHETSKSEDLLIGTKRRVGLLKNEILSFIKTNNFDKITLNYISKFDNKEEQFIFDISSLDYNSSGSTDSNMYITSQQIRQISSIIQESKEIIIKEIIKYYSIFIEKLINYENILSNICEYIILIDTLQNRCYIADTYNYCKPIIKEYNNTDNIDLKNICGEKSKSYIDIKGIRHCLIEHIQNRELYVTNDIIIGKNINGYLIYGTNAVGKTSLIRSIGISLIMAQSGLYTPCSSFVYYPYSYLFTRILGNDNLFKGQSTFAVEMSELRTILNMANKDSLILGDELCSGTEQGSATSIFASGLEYLDNLNSSYIFATHFHEINKWTEIKNIERLKMMHMTVFYDKVTKKLIYDRKLKDGPGENMYGLEVCKSLNLPEKFLEKAHQIRMKYYPETSNVTSFKSSHFNTDKIMGICELCKKNMGDEVHHLQHQNKVNGTNNYINNFHKNHLGNLVTVCDECHDKFHETNIQYKKVKTSNGYEFIEI